jgi:hypothetical protein
MGSWPIGFYQCLILFQDNTKQDNWINSLVQRGTWGLELTVTVCVWYQTVCLTAYHDNTDVICETRYYKEMCKESDAYLLHHT